MKHILGQPVISCGEHGDGSHAQICPGPLRFICAEITVVPGGLAAPREAWSFQWEESIHFCLSCTLGCAHTLLNNALCSWVTVCPELCLLSHVYIQVSCLG